MKSPLGSILALLLTAAVVLPLFNAARGMVGQIPVAQDSSFQAIDP
jgi:hypothetical protein